jgi:AcrR family transcriptional regulator
VPAGRKPTHSRDEYVLAAIKIADAGGIGDLSLRGLGRSMGVSATAVYRYFRHKDDLIVQIRETLLQQVLAGWNSSSDPREAIIELGLAYRLVARQHPCLSQIMVMPASEGVVAGAVPAVITRALSAMGVTDSDISLTYRQLESFVVGVTFFDFADAPLHLEERLERIQRADSPPLSAGLHGVADVERINEAAFVATLNLLVDSFAKTGNSES